MVEASPLLLTVTPKQLGRHLRDVRRKKGLSLSEVARGAGLSRRELVAYERGKVPIPESDLWVLAGSCGVDASELVPRTLVPELPAAPTSMGDTVAQLRRGQEQADLAPYLATLNRLQALPPGKRIPVKERELEEIATALGRDPVAIEHRLTQAMHVSPAEAARLREMILPPVAGPHRPRAIEAAPSFTEMAAEAPGNVDVFEELARLPEPIPLPDPGTPLPDMFATPPPPEGAVELVDSAISAAGASANGASAHGFATSAAGAATPAAAATLADAPVDWSAADAPPIDVTLRQSSDAWADWGKVPAPPTIEARRGTPAGTDPFAATQPGDGAAASDGMWEPPPWQPDGTHGSPTNGTPPAFWEGTDDWSPPADSPADIVHGSLIDAPGAESVDAWTSHEWPADLAGEPTPWEPMPGEPELVPNAFDTGFLSVEDRSPVVDAWAPTSFDHAGTALVDPAGGSDVTDTGPWSHEPDPEAVSTGFYVDWGTLGDDEPPAWHALIGSEPTIDDPQAQATDRGHDLARARHTPPGTGRSVLHRPVRR